MVIMLSPSTRRFLGRLVSKVNVVRSVSNSLHYGSRDSKQIKIQPVKTKFFTISI